MQRATPMPRRVGSIVVLGVLAVIALAPRPADACTCFSPDTLCAGLAGVDTVLIGTVREIATVGPGAADVTVDVHEVFAGAPGKTVRIEARGLGGSCDYGGYTVGAKMLIFGGMRGRAMHVFACSRTAPVSHAAADIAELRRMVKRGTATISGRISVEGSTSRAGIEVRVTGARTAQATRTDATGQYRVELPAGRYTIALPGDPLLVPRKPLPVEAIAGACVTQDIEERWNGRIRGTVRDRNGRPMAGVLVQCVPTSSTPPPAWDDPRNPWSPHTRSDARGAYELGPFRPDTYRVSVGVPFSPHEPYPPTSAPDVQLGPGAVVGGVDLVVAPRLATHAITARVALTGPGGPRDVSVEATERASGRAYNRFGPPGDFKFIDAAGGTLELRACIGDTGCVTRTVKVDRDRIVDLPIETHALTLRVVVPAPAPKWDRWRVNTTTPERSDLVGLARNEPLTLIGIAGNPVDLTACVLHGMTELGCAAAHVRFERDRVLELSIPLTP